MFPPTLIYISGNILWNHCAIWIETHITTREWNIFLSSWNRMLNSNHSNLESASNGFLKIYYSPNLEQPNTFYHNEKNIWALPFIFTGAEVEETSNELSILWVRETQYLSIPSSIVDSIPLFLNCLHSLLIQSQLTKDSSFR